MKLSCQIAILREYMETLKKERTAHKQCVHQEKELRENLSEKQLDKMVKDSFPASDPPSIY
jgi:hypothetical protein